MIITDTDRIWIGPFMGLENNTTFLQQLEFLGTSTDGYYVGPLGCRRKVWLFQHSMLEKSNFSSPSIGISIGSVGFQSIRWKFQTFKFVAHFLFHQSRRLIIVFSLHPYYRHNLAPTENQFVEPKKSENKLYCRLHRLLQPELEHYMQHHPNGEACRMCWYLCGLRIFPGQQGLGNRYILQMLLPSNAHIPIARLQLLLYAYVVRLKHCQMWWLIWYEFVMDKLLWHKIVGRWLLRSTICNLLYAFYDYVK